MQPRYQAGGMRVKLLPVNSRLSRMLQLFKVFKTYPPNRAGLKDVTLRVDDGEFVFLCGPSGAGKTTLLKLLFRGEDATSGQIIVNGRNITRLKGGALAAFRQELGLVFQDYKLIPQMTALENVSLAADVTGARPERQV